MGVYPAIDVSLSVSRVMNDITTDTHQDEARQFKRLVALFLENRDLISWVAIDRDRMLNLIVRFSYGHP